MTFVSLQGAFWALLAKISVCRTGKLMKCMYILLTIQELVRLQCEQTSPSASNAA